MNEQEKLEILTKTYNKLQLIIRDLENDDSYYDDSFLNSLTNKFRNIRSLLQVKIQKINRG